MLVCQCNGITEKEIVNVIKKKGATRLEQIQELTGAGTSCGRCIPVIEDLLDQHRNKTENPQLKIDF
ncbi:MAG: (2Fe-2S)-binding protein [Chlorobi bacterium]|nr:(2Fe-2S)-binding protein [Chlorobiota bacterium]